MFYSLNIKEVLRELDSRVTGLSNEEASIRLSRDGYNKISNNEKSSIISVILNQFKNPLVYILFFAFVISLITKHSIDAWIILIIILISSTIGFLQEYKASKALFKLKKMIKYNARVLRSNKELVTPQENLVKGDIILLFPGDIVPSDARLIDVQNFEVIEATLTGESNPSKKITNEISIATILADRDNMVYFGTIVSRGAAKAIVVETGENTELGKMANLIKNTKEEKTPLQIQINYLSKTIGVILIIVNVLIFGVGVLTGKPVFEMFLTFVALIVAAVPEGLLPATTIILAIGMQRLLRQKGLVRKMLATETLGSVSVICSDKTGTLTQGEMRVVNIISNFDNEKDHKADIFNIKIGVLCNDAIIENSQETFDNWKIIGNPIDKSFILSTKEFNLDKDELNKQEPRIAEIPFDSQEKFMATLHKVDNIYISYIKGAPEKVLELASFININGKKILLNKSRKEKLIKQFELLTSSGLRVLALAYSENISPKEFSNGKLSNLILSGFVGFKDPLRQEAKESIQVCQSAGIRPIIITGDHKLTAISIAKDLGLVIKYDSALDGEDLDRLSDEELRLVVKKTIIFARVEPRHKIRIVVALQQNGEVVAMVGDGVNDAPALKKADIGIAVGDGTSITKETADLVLLDNNFKTIIVAIKRGRIIFNNIRKVVLYLLTDSFSEMIIVGGSVLLSLPLPILPVQILWIKLVEDALPAMSLSFDDVDENVMRDKPRKKTEPIIDKTFKLLILFYALIMDLVLFLMFYYFWKTTNNLEYARTVVFVGLGITSLFYIYAVRGIKSSIFKLNPFSNKYLIYTTIFGMLLLVIGIYLPFFNNILKTVPLGIKEWLILFIYSVFSIFVYELGKKIIINRKLNMS